MIAPDRYAVRYIEADGSHSQGPDCKNWGCAVLTILPFDGRPLDAILINGTAHALREPVTAMAYLLQHRAVAEGIVAAIDARSAAPAAPVAERQPDGWAYRYPDGVIRVSGGREWNAMTPVEAIPYYFGSPHSTAAPAHRCSCPSGDGSLDWPCPRHQVDGPRFIMKSGQIRELAAMAGDEGDVPADEQSDIAIQQLSTGHSGPGMYAWIVEYPEEGAFFLDERTTELEHAAPAVEVDEAMVERAARVVCTRADEVWDHIGDFARDALMDTQRAALAAALGLEVGGHG